MKPTNHQKKNTDKPEEARTLTIQATQDDCQTKFKPPSLTDEVANRKKPRHPKSPKQTNQSETIQSIFEQPRASMDTEEPVNYQLQRVEIVSDDAEITQDEKPQLVSEISGGMMKSYLLMCEQIFNM